MKLQYSIWDPTKNITLLVSTPVPRAKQPDVAAALMAAQPPVEQVGFLEEAALPGAAVRLQMMGGEFCGNASMSTAAFIAKRDGLNGGAVPLEVSGYAGLLHCGLTIRDGDMYGTVAMPLPEKVSSVGLDGVGEVPAVFFAGIVHCIVPAHAMTRQMADEAIRPLCSALNADACGILLYDEADSAFTPLVYVAETGTAVWESGCGSGSAAIASYLAAQAGDSRSADLRQPGGAITAAATWADGRITRLSITGQVRFVAAGEIEI